MKLYADHDISYWQMPDAVFIFYTNSTFLFLGASDDDAGEARKYIETQFSSKSYIIGFTEITEKVYFYNIYHLLYMIYI